MRVVRGVGLDGTNVRIRFGRSQFLCLKATYGDKLETSTLSAMGEQAITVRTDGSYSVVDGKFSFESSYFRSEMIPRLVRRGFGLVRFPIIVAFEQPELGDDSDYLAQARIVDLAGAVDNSNKAQEVEIGVVYNQIFWGDARVTINRLDTSQPVGRSQF